MLRTRAFAWSLRYNRASDPRTDRGRLDGTPRLSHGHVPMQKASQNVVSPRVVCVEDFRPFARRRLPKPVFDYLDGGAEGEVTLRENCRVFTDVTFRPRQAVGGRGDCGPASWASMWRSPRCWPPWATAA